MNQRVQSLDAFRGFTIAAMLLVNNPGDWGHLYGPLAHAKWDGWTFTDWIFPFFVFISGISMTLSLGRRAMLGDNRQHLLFQTIKRGVVIIGIGLLLNFIPAFELQTLRLPGVLQRLGLCTILAAPLVLYFRWRAQLGWLVGLLVTYSVVQLCIPVPDGIGVWHTGSLLPGEDVGAWVDRALMDGHLWRASKTWDPEGLLSTVPAVASQLAGVLVGQWLATRCGPMEKTTWLLVTGLVLLWLAQVLDAWSMPINKSLWSPAYVVMTTGWACLVFGVFYWFIDAAPEQTLRSRCASLTTPLVIFGRNALFIFALSGLVAKLLVFIKVSDQLSLKGWLFTPLSASALSPVNASLGFAVAFTSGMFVIAWVMWRRGWFIKV